MAGDSRMSSVPHLDKCAGQSKLMVYLDRNFVSNEMAGPSSQNGFERSFIMQLTSPSFQQGAEIPSYYTSDGEDASPELSWRDAPLNAQSFVLIIHDPMRPSRADLRIGLCTTFHPRQTISLRMYPIPSE
jgi:hypothetical protein